MSDFEFEVTAEIRTADGTYDATMTVAAADALEAARQAAEALAKNLEGSRAVNVTLRVSLKHS